MSLSQLPTDSSSLVDGQTIEVVGADGIIKSFIWDEQTRSFTLRDSQLFVPTKHGNSHISTDPIPVATCDQPGLMAPNDKCRLDTLSQMRMGVLGYAGAGMPDDGGWLQEDIILAAGNNGYLSIERIGNVIRFTVTPPITYTCSCESCATLYWVFDETEPFSVRPPTCSGRLPGVNAYGEVKFYMMPESLIVDPANPSATLGTKGNYPSMVFKRYNNAISTGLASFELVLKRDGVNKTQSEVGWSFLPGSSGVVECVWFTGKDSAGNLTKFSLNPYTDPGVLGALFSNGNLITKRMAIVTGYVATTPSSNVYYCKLWDVLNATTVGDEFTATNVWNYNNNGTGSYTLVTDGFASTLVKTGTLLDIWMFEVGQGTDGPIYRYFMNQEPMLDADDVWSSVGVVQFGDTVDARVEVEGPGTGGDESMAYQANVDYDGFENTVWGLSNTQDIRFYDNGGSIESYVIKRATVSTAEKGLKILPDNFSTSGTTDKHTKPVFLWNRNETRPSFFAVYDIGFPAEFDVEDYPLLDICWGPHEAQSDQFARVVRSRDKALTIENVDYNSTPRVGQWQCVYPPARAGLVFNQASKSVEYVASSGVKPTIYTEGTNQFQAGDILKLLSRDFTTNAVRIICGKTLNTYFMRVLSGVLGMGTLYQSNGAGDLDDYIRGFEAGYVVSTTYAQDGLWDGLGTPPDSNVSGFNIVSGTAGTGTERWNRLEVMVKDNRLWMWWNGLLIPPNTQSSALLPVPVNITSQYYPFEPIYDLGKLVLRMWPGLVIRRAQVMTQNVHVNEYQNGQIILS